MGFVVKYNFILDLLGAFNVLVKNASCVNEHEEVYERFGKNLSRRGKEALELLKSEMSGQPLGEALIHRLVSNENFHLKTLKECFGADAIGEAVTTLGEELIEKGFHEYWLEEVMPLLDARAKLVEGYIKDERDIWAYRAAFVNQSEVPTILWICYYGKLQPVQLEQHQYIGDVSLITDYLKANGEVTYPSEYGSFAAFFEAAAL